MSNKIATYVAVEDNTDPPAPPSGRRFRVEIRSSSFSRTLHRSVVDGIRTYRLAEQVATALNNAYALGEKHGYLDGLANNPNNRRNNHSPDPTQDQTQAKTELVDRDLLTSPIELLGLSVRAFNCLKRNSIHTISDLVMRDSGDLHDIRNLGRKSHEEITTALKAHGLSLRRATTNGQ
jgi:Bacterial RNA polymerase, alpha chain C terminal domain